MHTYAKPQQPKGRRLSRPARLEDVRQAVCELRQEYDSWLAALPPSLVDGVLAEGLAETVEQLEAVSDLLADLEPPKGFGRD